MKKWSRPLIHYSTLALKTIWYEKTPRFVQIQNISHFIKREEPSCHSTEMIPYGIAMYGTVCMYDTLLLYAWSEYSFIIHTTVYTVLNIRAYRVISSDGYRLLQKPSRFCVSCVLRCVVWARAVGCLVSNHPPYPFKLFNRIETNYINTMAVLSEFPSCVVSTEKLIPICNGMYVV